MKNWKPILGIVLTFIFGTLTGGLVVAGFAKNRIEHFIRNGADNAAPLIVRRLDSKLDLTAEQKGKLNLIVTDGQNHLRSIRHRVEPEVKASLSATVEQIRSILTRSQKAQFDELVKKSEQRFGSLH